MTVEPSDTKPGRGPSEEFVQLFTRAQRSLYLLILAQVGNVTAAEEILQETNLVIWAKMAQFQPGSNFDAWARQIATYEVLKYRQRRQRDRLTFSDDFLNAVSEEVAMGASEMQLRQEALRYCLGKLSARDRELVELRYQPGQSGRDLALLLGRPRNSISQSLGRIRKALLECIQRRLAVAEAGS